MNQRNRRKQPRLVTNLKVNFRSGSRNGSAYTLDLSIGGLFLQTADELSLNEWVQLSFSVSSSGEKRPVQCIAQVRRILTREQAAATGMLPGIAVEFRKFLQGLEELRNFLADRLQLPVQQVGQPTLGPVPDVLGPSEPLEIPTIPAAATARRAQETTKTYAPMPPILEPAFPPSPATQPWRVPEVAQTPIAVTSSATFHVPQPFEPAGDAIHAEPISATAAPATPAAGIAFRPVLAVAARTAAVVAVLVVLSWVLYRTGVTPWDPVPWSVLPWGPPR